MTHVDGRKFTITSLELTDALTAIASCPWGWTTKAAAKLAADVAPQDTSRTPAMLAELSSWRNRPAAALSARLYPLFSAAERSYGRCEGEGVSVAFELLLTTDISAALLAPTSPGDTSPADGLFNAVCTILRHERTADFYQTSPAAVRRGDTADVQLNTYEAATAEQIVATNREQTPGNDFHAERLDGDRDGSGLKRTGMLSLVAGRVETPDEKLSRAEHVARGMSELRALFTGLGFDYDAVMETIHSEVTRTGAGHGRRNIGAAENHNKALGQRCKTLGVDAATEAVGRHEARAAGDSAALHGMCAEQWRAACVIFLGSTDGKNLGVPALLMEGLGAFSTRAMAGARNKFVAGGPAARVGAHRTLAAEGKAPVLRWGLAA